MIHSLSNAGSEMTGSSEVLEASIFFEVLGTGRSSNGVGANDEEVTKLTPSDVLLPKDSKFDFCGGDRA